MAERQPIGSTYAPQQCAGLGPSPLWVWPRAPGPGRADPLCPPLAPPGGLTELGFAAAAAAVAPDDAPPARGPRGGWSAEWGVVHETQVPAPQTL